MGARSPRVTERSRFVVGGRLSLSAEALEASAAVRSAHSP